MSRLALRRLAIISVLFVVALGGLVLASPDDAVLSIAVRDPTHPRELYQSTPHNFFVQIFDCEGLPLVREGVDYGTFPGVPMTIPGPKGGRVQIDLAVPAGCYLVRALARCKNVISDWAYVEARGGDTVRVNLILPTVKHCLLRMAAALRLATVDPEGQEDQVISVWPSEVQVATDGLLRIAHELPDDSHEFPDAPDLEGIVRLPDKPPPEPAVGTNCCSGTGGLYLDLALLPHPAGALPPLFVYKRVVFAEVHGDIQFSGGSLLCSGSQSVAGTRHDATVRLNFLALSCAACTVTAEVDGHGPEAVLLARLADGTIATNVCPGGQCVLTVAGTETNPIVVVELSGQEAEWFWVKIE